MSCGKERCCLPLPEEYVFVVQRVPGGVFTFNRCWYRACETYIEPPVLSTPGRWRRFAQLGFILLHFSIHPIIESSCYGLSTRVTVSSSSNASVEMEVMETSLTRVCGPPLLFGMGDGVVSRVLHDERASRVELPPSLQCLQR